MNRTQSLQYADALRDEIAHTRAELGETVQALAARADFPARAKDSASRTMGRVRGGGPRMWAGLGGGVALAAVLVALVRMRRPRRGWARYRSRSWWR